MEERKEIHRLPATKTGRPVRVLLSPDGSLLYVLIRAKKSAVWVFDTKTNEQVGTIPVGGNSNDFALSSDGRWLVSSSFAEDRLSVIDTSSREIVGTHAAPTGSGLIMHPSKPRVYSIASFEDEVVAVDYQSGARLGAATLASSPQYGTISPDGTVLYVANEDSNRMIAIDSETMKQLWRTGVGDEPADVEYVVLSGRKDTPDHLVKSGAAVPPTALSSTTREPQ